MEQKKKTSKEQTTVDDELNEREKKETGMKWNVLFEQHVKAKFCKPPDYYVLNVVLRFKVRKFILHAVRVAMAINRRRQPKNGKIWNFIYAETWICNASKVIAHFMVKSGREPCRAKSE